MSKVLCECYKGESICEPTRARVHVWVCVRVRVCVWVFAHVRVCV